MAEDKVTIKQIRSVNGRTQQVKDTLTALGLGRIGKSREHNLTPPIAGMVKKVRHLVEVRKA